jgi:hypothetical protein
MFESKKSHFILLRLFYICRSLDPLNYIRIWYDNTSRGASASWFLKYIIVRDLWTMGKSHFICQQWLAVEKDDGQVSFILTLFLSIPNSFLNRSNVV